MAEHRWDGPKVELSGGGMVPTCSVCGVDASDQVACNPDDEITSEMIRAGVTAFYSVRDWGEEPGEWAVERIYRAMRGARPAASAAETPVVRVTASAAPPGFEFVPTGRFPYAIPLPEVVIRETAPATAEILGPPIKAEGAK